MMCRKWLPPMDKRVAVAGGDPDVQLRAREFQPRRERRRPAVDLMEAVGVQ